MPFTSSGAPATSELFEGGYYSVAGEETFRVAKILKLEPEKVHVGIYKQEFSQRPQALDLNSLTLGTIDDEDGFGMGHLPLRLETFKKWEPGFLAYSEVTADELGGYKLWKESARGAVFE